MIFFFMLAATQLAAPPATDDTYSQCLAVVRDNPEGAIQAANEWRLRGGAEEARQCLGQAYARLERWEPAATAFEQGALEAETARNARAVDLWTQAGNAWLAAGDAARARKAFGAALASPALTSELRGEVHLDRARAAVAQDDLPAARADLDEGLKLVPADPFAWYLSAALAAREGDRDRAARDIAKADALAPGDSTIGALKAQIDAASADAQSR